MIPLGLWHCFGVQHEIVDLATVRRMLDASGTRVLPVNTDKAPRYLIGHGDVTWDSFKTESAERGLTACLNINLRTTVTSAVQAAERASDATGLTLLKLEVLHPWLTESDDYGVCVATALLRDRGFTVMPLISASLDAARVLIGLDVPLLRVMGSPIGSGLGILYPAKVLGITRMRTPVILDGGIGTPRHAERALELGCKGFLVNSCLFTGGDPADNLRPYRAVFDPTASAA